MKILSILLVLGAAASSFADEVAACRVKIDDALKACDTTANKSVKSSLETARKDLTKAPAAAATTEKDETTPAPEVRRTRVFRGTSN